MVEKRPALSPCPCGSELTFEACHGADANPDPSASAQNDGSITHGYWLAAFVDLLGQKEAFLKTDYLPNTEDPEKEKAFLAEVKASTGVILGMRKILASFRVGLSEDTGAFDDLSREHREMAERLQRTRVREFRMSDGIVLACPLMREDGHFPIRGVYDVVATCAVLMCVQLAAERPIRGGIDVGTGMEIDGELFGPSLVKAYVLESKYAKYPRLAVGQDVVNYLMTSTKTMAPGIESRYERQLAEGILRLLKRDSDQQWIVDYAGSTAREFLPRLIEMLEPAKAFAQRTRAALLQRDDEEGRKLFGRYTLLVRYLEASGLT
jgi:hypothetical protein